MARNNNSNQTTSNSSASRALPVVFLHPREGSEFGADITATTTGQAAVDGLVEAGFIPAPTETATYALQLQRTGKSLPLSGPLVDGGVAANDRITIVASQTGN